MLAFYLSLIETEEDERTVTHLYNRYYSALLYAANRYTKDSMTAEDLAHSVFVIVIKKLHDIRLDNEQETLTYLLVILQNTAKRYFRKIGKENLVDDEQAFDFMSIDESSLSKYTMQNPIFADLIHEINKLEPVSRKIVFDRVLKDLTFAQIGKKLKIKEENARKIYQRAREKLVKTLEDKNRK